ncbi:MAG: hypothetical protein CMP69_04320 [Flavobacteriales bacterium]|nr:hypothetical protein [Flavobacteriales bacterium]MBH70446.1 hypothetical protein [Flavobacteriales bacterium]|tara:strand:+ start:1599 stop:1880 length:282 start_codon:yes stop_codon:yes gene_type:complete
MKNIIENIENKLTKFIDNHNELKSKLEIIEKENKKISLKLIEKKQEVLNLQEKIKLMNISKSVDVSNEDLQSTRLKINEYVREIDKCIALLNK